jgi:hypothetical protein
MSEFLARWSRLKRGDAEAPEVTPEAPVLPAVESAAEVAAEPEFDLSLLPSLEELTTETDIKGFLHKAVPAGLRNAALKRMWALDPAIRDFVGPVDYAWDFNDPAGLPGISESLTGDVSQLLARAIGAAPQQEPQTDLLAEAPQPELPIALAAPPEQQPAAPEPLAVPAETVAVRPRHGSARPV